MFVCLEGSVYTLSYTLTVLMLIGLNKVNFTRMVFRTVQCVSLLELGVSGQKATGYIAFFLAPDLVEEILMLY